MKRELSRFRIQLPLFMQAMYLGDSLDQLSTVGSLSLIQNQVLPQIQTY